MFSDASLLLFPSDFEGFGLPVVEAMMLGIPVVCSDLEVFSEIAGDSILYAKSDLPEHYSDLCSQVMTNEQYKNTIISAQKLQAAKFTWKRTAAQTRTILQQTISGS
jgi:glycosyltransferase involved in cell wall biosynthesis